ncbi:Hypothetical protein PHPALM_6208 [Phytophthora palmivora]|uniref:Reverse transcriptase RNase H-like domain-containing protein n=1 Tax=Phytophthora palmivora TaxID=4796 RepID=A0A2P4YFI0_9STRA|nr:Hypothetical protein PHPALM_6208 [Phytophthora palmivora]
MAMAFVMTTGELIPYVRRHILAWLLNSSSAINWMRDSIIDFTRQVEPLQPRLDVALAHTKRTKRAAASIEIELEKQEQQAFDDVKEALVNAATLDFPDDKATTYASDVGYAIIITQGMDFDPMKPATEQQHHLTRCTSGTFTGSQCNWTVIENEAFPIVVACDKLDYLLLRPRPFRMHCDHRNLIHIFAPHESVKKHVKGKLLQWAMKLMNYRYVVEHVPGHSNVWADMISRWGGNHTPTLKRL